MKYGTKADRRLVSVNMEAKHLAAVCSYNYTRKVELSLKNYVEKKRKEKSVPGVASVVNHPLDCVEALPLVWDVEGFKDVREGGIVPTHPRDGSLQVEEALLLQQRTQSHVHTSTCPSVSVQASDRGNRLWHFITSVSLTSFPASSPVSDTMKMRNNPDWNSCITLPQRGPPDSIYFLWPFLMVSLTNSRQDFLSVTQLFFFFVSSWLHILLFCFLS